MDTVKSRPRLVPVAMAVSLGVAVMAGAAASWMAMHPPSRTQRGPAPTSPPAEIRFALPDFALTERSGEKVTRQDLLGKVWVASFVFARCTGPCPSVTRTMVRLQDELNLKSRDDLRLVTFTVDPERDDPGELRKYAKIYDADPGKWLFLTGPEDAIHTLLNKSFKIQAGPTKNPHPAPGQEFDHSTRLVVVDKRGNIRGYFDGYRGPNDPSDENYETSLRNLEAMVRELEGE